MFWGSVNIKLPQHSFDINKERAIDYLNTKDTLFVVDAFAGWEPTARMKCRIICSRAYHALFMHNMLIRPTEQELADFGEPDLVVFNAGMYSNLREGEGREWGGGGPGFLVGGGFFCLFIHTYADYFSS